MSQHKKQVWRTCTQTLKDHICVWHENAVEATLFWSPPDPQPKERRKFSLMFSRLCLDVKGHSGSIFSLFFPFKTYSKFRDDGSCVTLFLFGSRGGIYKLSDFYKGFLREVAPKPLTITGPGFYFPCYIQTRMDWGLPVAGTELSDPSNVLGSSAWKRKAGGFPAAPSEGQLP